MNVQQGFSPAELTMKDARLADLEQKGVQALRGAQQSDGAERTYSGDSLDRSLDNEALDSEEIYTGVTAQRLARVQREREAIRERTFGICEDCGARISKVRLNAFHGIVTCVNCEREREKEAA